MTKATHHLDDGARTRSPAPQPGGAVTTTAVGLRRDRAPGAPPPWGDVERHVRTGTPDERVEVCAAIDATFSADLELRRHTERPPWRLVEAYLQDRESSGWVRWYEGNHPDFARLIEARRCNEQPPWELVEEYLLRGEYAEWVEDHAGRSLSFARVLATMASSDDESAPISIAPLSSAPLSSAPPSPLSSRSGRVIAFGSRRR